MKKKLFTLIFMLIGCAVMAQSAVKQELYKSARRNFARGKYVDAIRDFSGFQAANDSYLELHPSLKNAIGLAITICEKKIEESRRAEERRKNGVMEIEANAIIAAPGPVYLLPTDSTLSHHVKTQWRGMLYRLIEQPFAALQITCLTNADSTEREDYVMSRISLFNKEVEELNIAIERIQWEVDPKLIDAGYLSSCMQYYGPPPGSICLNVRLISDAAVFELEP